MEELEVLERPKQKQLARLLTPSGQHSLSVTAVPGETVQELVERSIPLELRSYIVAFNRGQKIVELENYYIQEDDQILLAVVPQGGGGGGKGNILGSVLMIAVMVAAVAVTGGAAAGVLGASFASGTVGAAVLGAGISMVGMMAISALVPPPSVNTGTSTGSGGSITTSPTYTISGQSNGSRKYGVVAKIYGTHKYYPTIACNPIVYNIGTDSRISALYDFGLGEVQVSDLKVGDSDIYSYGPELFYHTNSLCTDLQYVNRSAGYDQYTYVTKKDTPIFIKTKPDSVGADIDLSFPQGLCRIDDKGNNVEFSVYFEILYRKVGDPTWIKAGSDSIHGANASQTDSSAFDQAWYLATYPDILGSKWPHGAWEHFNRHGRDEGRNPSPPAGYIQIKGDSPRPFTAGVGLGFTVPGQYEIQIIRRSGDSTDSRILDNVNVTMLKSWGQGKILNLNRKHTMLEMRVFATDKLQGTIQNLSGIATSVLRYTGDNGATFATKATNNPAWIAVDILTGEANAKPLSDNSIDWPSWQKLAEYCDREKITANFVVDYSVTVQELLNSVLSIARASMKLTSSGKYGVMIDQERTTPVQIITPSNSWGFQGGRTFSDRPHAFLVNFINGEDSTASWQKDERIVYDDGYDSSNATKFETLNTFGITNSDQAWKYGRYMLAQGIHRSETFTVNMDVENLVVQRGDLVHVAHDVPKIGGMPCRVVDVIGNDITIDQVLSVIPTGYSVRLDDGTVRTGKITATTSTSNSFTLDNTAGIHSDDLIVLGITNRVVEPYIVQSINAGANLTAEIQMVRYVPEIYNADKGAIPPWNPGFGDDLINTTDLKVVDLVATQQLTYKDKMPFAEINLKWKIEGFNYGKSEIYYSTPTIPQTLLGESTGFNQQMLVDLLKQKNLVDVPVTFEVVPLSSTGVVGTSATILVNILPDRQAPVKPVGFTVNVQDMLVELFWEDPIDQDIDYYEIRYAPDPILGSWNASQQLAIIRDSTKTSAGARTGKYFIQAVDTSGNKSEVAWQRTTIETLPHVNQVQIVDDQPLGWPGTLSGMVKNTAGSVELSGDYGSVNPEGYYYFKDFIKFDEIYEVRVSNKTIMHGRHNDDIVAHWKPTVANIGPTLVSATAATWNALLQVRTSDGVTVMKDWVPLASAVPIEMSNVQWTEWRNVTVTDLTARQIQFRIKAESFSPDVKVVLIGGEVVIDANDWVWKKSDVVVPTSGAQILYDPPFMYKPIVALTIDGTTTAMTYEQTNANRKGFNLRLVDSSGSSVAGKVDIAALGQGKQRTKSI